MGKGVQTDMSRRGNSTAMTIIASAAVIIMMLLSMGRITSVLKHICIQETNAIYAIAGIAIQENPSLELQVIQALKENGTIMDEQQAGLIELGQQSLVKYGYEPDILFRSRSLYPNLSKLLYGSIAGITVVGIGAGLLLIWQSSRRNRRWQQQVLAVITQYREGEYAFADQIDSLGEANPAAGSSLLKLSDQLKLLGSQIRYQKQSLMEEKESTKELVTDISHQLKTPLAALYTSFEMYQEADSEEERQEFGGRMEYQIHKLQRLIAGLVQVSRMEHAMIVLHREAGNIQDILQGAVNSIYEKAQKRGIEVQTSCSGEEWLLLDQKWTEEAIVNVLDNAVKYSPMGSTIQLTAMPYVSFWRIEIMDRGIGISKEEYTEIFKRFYRSSDKRVKETEGAGVGLFLTRMILERQGGSIYVRERAGGGSIFVIQLPR